MRILMVHNRYLVSGGEDESTQQEAELLRGAGHEVELLEEDNRTIATIGRLRTAVRTTWSRPAYRRVSALLGSRPFDILHVQNFFPLLSPSIYYAAAAARVPVVQSLRNYRLICANGLFFREGRVCVECDQQVLPWHSVRYGCYRESTAASAAVATMIAVHRAMGTWQRRVQRFIALTEFARRKFVDNGIPADHIAVKSNFVGGNPVPGDGSGGFALYVGRLFEGKGIELLLRAWTQVSNSARLMILGEGPLAGLVQQAAHSNLGIEYSGRRSRSDVMQLLRQAKFLVFPSESFEGMPRSIIEAFSVGTPVVASDLGGMKEMVTSGVNGLLFRPGDPNALAVAAQSMFQGSNTTNFRADARREYELKYTAEHNLNLLLSIYHDAIQALFQSNGHRRA